MPGGEAQRIYVAGSQQRRFLASMLAKNWAHCVNHMPGRHVPSWSDHGLTSWQSVGMSSAPNLSTGFRDCAATRSMNRAINSATSQQRSVGCVDDRINRETGDVAYDHSDSSVKIESAGIGIQLKCLLGSAAD